MFYENKRHTIRLQKHDYSTPGYYFLTIGSYKHSCIFGEIKNGKFFANEIGKIVEKWIFEIPKHFQNTLIDKIQIMPNHLHLIIKINKKQNLNPNQIIGRGNRAPTIITLGKIIAYSKYQSTKEINCRGGVSPPLYKINMNHYFEGHIFQRNYYEHIIRNQNDLIKHQYYILNNPKNWSLDKEHPSNLKTKK